MNANHMDARSLRFSVDKLACAIAAACAMLPMMARAADCQSLSGQTIAGALVIETNDINPPFVIANAGAQRVSVTTPFCRVRGLLRPTSDSNIYFEVWLPRPEAWNGNYQCNAPGGYVGSMFYEPTERALRAGYAASTTDNGHIGSDPAEWALGHPEKFADWGWRAVHETAVATKAIIAAYYGTGPRFSYFIGCSKGGGSAMMEAQRFPTDYDGVIAGAMGWNLSARLAMYLWTIQAARTPGAWLPPAKLELLHRSVLASCGATDGMLDNPGACNFDPGRLQCTAADATSCLTAEQVASVRKIYAGPVDAGGRSLYPGYPRGSELNWSRAIMGQQGEPGVGTTTYLGFINRARDVLSEHGNWDLRTLDPVDVYRQARQKLGSAWDAADTDLAAFKARGGKIIAYQGWTDDAVPANGTIDYFDRVANRMGGLDNTTSFFRLFLASGMDHCGGGIGPNAIGGPYGLPAPVYDAAHDVTAALARWVEQGQAPERIVATHYRDNDPSRGITAQRPLCPYPAAARFNGPGDGRQAMTWACTAPATHDTKERRAP
jgi:feruloyl esterase